jgi:hypothetical protein
MINTEELGIDEAQLASGDFSLDELKAILADINAGENAAEASTRHIRAAARKDRYDFADGKAKGKKDRQRQEQKRIRSEAKGLDQKANESSQSGDHSQAAVETPKPDKVIDLQQQRRKRSIDFFDEMLKSDDQEQCPQVVTPKWKDRFW